MTDKEILTEAIDKATINGWDRKVGSLLSDKDIILWDSFVIRGTILTHSFAKAFWGEEPYYGTEFHQLDKNNIRNFNEGGMNRLSNWQYHLQIMALEEQPLKYLEKYL